MEKRKNKPILRFPQFSEDWKEIKLENLLEFKNGINATKEQYGSGYKFINVLDILNNDFITYNSIIGSVNVDEETVSKYPVSYGDILFQRSSETREEVGTASVYLDHDKVATFGGFVIRGKKIGEYDPEFLSRLLKTDLAREQITSKSGGSTRYNVGQEILASVLLLFPTLAEQNTIALFLNYIDTKIHQLKQKKNLLEQYKKGVLQKLFSQELRFKDNKGKEFPKWEKKYLGEIAKITTGSSNREDSNLDGEFTFFDRSQDIRTSNKFLFDTEAIIVPGEGKEFIPKYFNGKFDLHQRTYAVMNFEGQSGKFLYYSISFNSNHLNSHAVGSTVKSLRLPMFDKMPIELPSRGEQTKIANFLSAIDEKINKTDNQIQQTQAFKKGLLQNMFV
ncbi:MAG: restriction endonuclease subunit S [Bacteroidetes bacterium]|nr:restriction endonuclease subunit S [Bacteroidota bacterium]